LFEVNVMATFWQCARRDGRATRHYCPRCLRGVGASETQRRAHREPCQSGALEAQLLQCPTCGLVLAAEIDAQALPLPLA